MKNIAFGRLSFYWWIIWSFWGFLMMKRNRYIFFPRGTFKIGQNVWLHGRMRVPNIARLSKRMLTALRVNVFPSQIPLKICLSCPWVLHYHFIFVYHFTKLWQFRQITETTMIKFFSWMMVIHQFKTEKSNYLGTFLVLPFQEFV